ncbi:uncharacterized protein LOC133716331 [Rosa rugosa]|uniref:uncharacterized protein LOC133716331 n=1 Tax=Rosa rugosa TaxID=74645 RepID=UPI002B401AC9|nr:uncharacterized protein LOC133716331 [Rosa rugosa]
MAELQEQKQCEVKGLTEESLVDRLAKQFNTDIPFGEPKLNLEDDIDETELADTSCNMVYVLPARYALPIAAQECVENEEGIEAFHSLYERLSSYLVEKEAYDRVATLEIVNEELSDQEQADEEEIQLAPAALDDTPPKVRDPTEKRAINLIFHDILGKILEVYIDDVVVKSKQRGDHITDLRKVFERMRLHKLKMNPAKCIFGVQAGDFLGFIVHQRGIEVPEDKASAVINASSPRTKKELQRLLGKINFLRRFISNSAGKIQPFSPLLKLQGQNEFVWKPKHQEAFDKIKAYLASPPVLVPPRAGIPLKLYISAAEASIGSLLAQDDEEGVEHAIFYLSRTLTDCETRYTPMEKLCLTLYFLACKLRHYMLSFTTCIIAQTDLVKYILSPPILRGCIGKWVLALSEFSLQYVPQKAVKGQAIADFLVHHPMLDVPTVKELEIATADITRPDLARIPEYAIWYQATCTNNQAEYEALIIGLEVLLELGVRDVQIRGDSLLVINQLQEKYRCVSCLLVPYLDHAIELLNQFDDVGLEFIPRERNFAANELAQLATGITLKYGVRERILKVERRTLTSWLTRPDTPDDPVVAVLEPIDVYWRIPLIAYLKQPDPTADRKIRFLALNYFLRGDELRRRGEDGIDFRCVFGVPEVLVSDRGAAFMGGDVEQLVNDLGIHFVHSTAYYAQSNGQAEDSNKIIITLLKKMLVANPRQWHETLYETLWAYRTSKLAPTATTPYALMFGHDAVLPLEINVQSLRVQD